MIPCGRFLSFCCREGGGLCQEYTQFWTFLTNYKAKKHNSIYLRTPIGTELKHTRISWPLTWWVVFNWWMGIEIERFILNTIPWSQRTLGLQQEISLLVSCNSPFDMIFFPSLSIWVSKLYYLHISGIEKGKMLFIMYEKILPLYCLNWGWGYLHPAPTGTRQGGKFPMPHWMR